jgi:phosphohistidine phosphatase
MKLCFFRHGIAAPKGLMPDSKRPLTSEGRAKVKKAARGLKELDLAPDLILTSPFARAKETAEILAKELDLKKGAAPCEALEPNRPLSDLLKELDHRGKMKSVIVVGHEPGLSHMISELISGGRLLKIDLKKAGACCLELDLLSPGRKASLLWLLTSKQLRRLA